MTFLTVSTLGAPGASLQTVLSWLQTAGVSGLELRLSPNEIAHPAMTARQQADVAAAISDAGVTVTGIASYVQVASAANDEMVIGALASAMNLAAALGAPMVRVFPGAPVHASAYSEKPRLLEPAEPGRQPSPALVETLAGAPGMHEVPDRADRSINPFQDPCDVGALRM